MKRLSFLIGILFAWMSVTGQTLIVGGGQVCKTNGDPDLNAALAEQDQRYECSVAWDTLGKKFYVYRASDPVGSRWDEFTGGGGGPDTRVDSAYVSADTLRLLVRDLDDLSTVKIISVPVVQIAPVQSVDGLTGDVLLSYVDSLWATPNKDSIAWLKDGTIRRAKAGQWEQSNVGIRYLGKIGINTVAANNFPDGSFVRIYQQVPGSDNEAIKIISPGGSNLFHQYFRVDTAFWFEATGSPGTRLMGFDAPIIRVEADSMHLILGNITPPTGSNLKLLAINAAGKIVEGSAGSGTVTQFNFTNGNGFTGIVTNATTTPTLSLTLQDAAADGTTKGQATFTAADFNSSSGSISLDYTNGQKANGSQPGFLSSADWTTFNGKIGGSGTTGYIPKFSASTTLTDSKFFETSNTVSLGTNTGIDAFTRLYIYGGSSGANVDARGVNGAATDQAVFEVQGSDYSTNFRSMWIKYSGVSATGTTAGVSNADFAELAFQDPANALIRSITNVPIQVFINNSQMARFTSSALEVRAGKDFRQYDSDNTNFVAFVPPATGTLTADATYILPATNTNGVLTNTGGTLTWAASGGSGTVTSVATSGPSAGFTVTGGPITTSGTLTFALADDLAALEGLSGTGIPARTAADTWALRTITGTTNRVSVTDGNGVSGNPTIDISSSYVGQASITTLGTIATGVWQGTVVGTTYGGTGLSAIGTANQLIRVNAGATALEYFTPTFLTANQTITLSGDVTGTGSTAITTTIANNAVTDAKFRQSVARSVVGNGTNATANVADIQGTADQVLRVNTAGTALAFGTVATGGIANSAVTYSKIQDVSATNKILGRFSSGAGVVEEIGLGSGFAFSGGNITFTETGNGTVTSVATSQPAAGLTITGGPITTSGTFTFALANDLSALEGLSSTGLAARTGTDTWAQRTVTGTTNRITVTNGSGASGNPTIDISTSYAGQATIVTVGTVTAGTWQADVINPDYGGTGLNALGTANQMLRVNAGGTALEYFTPTFTGTVTSVSVVTANGFAGSVANATTTPAITISTNQTGLLQGNGTAISGITNSTTVGQVLRVTGANTYAWGALDLTDADAITNDLPFANLTQGSARSVLGVTGNSTADVASIQGTANQVLVINSAGTALAFGQVNLASSSAVTGVLPVANGGAPAGTTGQTLHYSGTTLTANSYLTNNGTTVGINSGTLGRLAVIGMTGGVGISVTGTPTSFGAQFYGSSSITSDSYYGVDFENTATSGNVLYTFRNLGTTTSSNALMQITTPHGAGDPMLQFISTGGSGNTWTTGLDNDDGDAYCIAPANVLGSTTALKLNTSGQAFWPGGYGASTFSGTPATYPAFTATGAMIERTAGQLASDLGVTSGAPVGANYLLVGSLNATLTNDRLATEGNNINFVDAGANSNFTIEQGTEAVYWTNDISPAQFGTNQNDWNPTGWGTSGSSSAVAINISLSANVQITGLAGGADGRWALLNNLDADNSATLVANSASSSAANRFQFRNNIVLESNENALLYYSAAKGGWVLMGKSSTSDPSVISPSSIGSDQNDYTPTNWTGATNVRLNVDAGIRAITGFGADTGGEEKTISNVSGSPFYITPESPNSTAANRISAGQDIIVLPGRSIRIMYDDVISRWRVLDQTELSNASRGVQVYEFSPGSVTAGDWPTWGFSTSGGATAAQNAISGIPGATDVNTSTSSTGSAMIYAPKIVNSSARFGEGHLDSYAYLSIPTLSDGTNRYTVQFAITASASGTTLTVNNAIGIRYSDNINGGVWEGFTRNNSGTESTVTLNASVSASSLTTLRVSVDKSLTEVRFFVNDTYAGRITTNLPASGTACGTRIGIWKSVGTTSRSLYIHGAKNTNVYP